MPAAGHGIAGAPTPATVVPDGRAETGGSAGHPYQLGEKRRRVGAEAPLENQLSK
jgi:hypothetical protein